MMNDLTVRALSQEDDHIEHFDKALCSVFEKQQDLALADLFGISVILLLYTYDYVWVSLSCFHNTPATLLFLYFFHIITHDPDTLDS